MSDVLLKLDELVSETEPHLYRYCDMPVIDAQRIHNVCKQAFDEIWRLKQQVNEMHLTEIREFGT